ncbi:hypothetical protein [Rhodococcoides fascians]|uniref:hypothetical protein n=1 Tax=Rhodococcoides fascians TaxID=1828 RepID=UPI000AC372EA|nr:hypothetical protein [Rhodococcus fascians]
MSDFTPVELVKGDIEFTAHTPTQLCNALYGGGFKRKPAATAPAETEVTDTPILDAAPVDTAGDKTAGTRRRRTATTEETA